MAVKGRNRGFSLQEKIPEAYGQKSIFGGSKPDARLQEIECYYAPELAAMY